MTVKYNFEEIDHPGMVSVRFLTAEIYDYDASNGESLDKNDAGMSRIQRVVADEVGGDNLRVSYERPNDVLRLFEPSGELAADAGTESDPIYLELMVFGRQ